MQCQRRESSNYCFQYCSRARRGRSLSISADSTANRLVKCVADYAVTNALIFN